jgi:hypothetical protein
MKKKSTKRKKGPPRKANQTAMEAPKKFPFAPAKSPRRVFPQVDPDKEHTMCAG